MKRIFITATGTGIGKTYFTTHLTRQLRAKNIATYAIKPLMSGLDEGWEESDTALLLKANGLAADITNAAQVTHSMLKASLSPDMAARAENKVIDYDALLAFCMQPRDAEVLLIEGAGGVMVPLTQDKTTLDLMQDCTADVIIVAGSYLGAISHLLTALETLKNRDITPQHIVINESPHSNVPAQEMLQTLRNFTPIPITWLPYHPTGGMNNDVTHVVRV